jgi:type III secretory pathway component EscR
MIVWFTTAQVAVAVVAGLLCVALGLAGRKPSDLSLGALALVELLLVVQLVVAIVAPATGNEPVGNMLEFECVLVFSHALVLLFVDDSNSHRNRCVFDAVRGSRSAASA